MEGKEPTGQHFYWVCNCLSICPGATQGKVMGHSPLLSSGEQICLFPFSSALSDPEGKHIPCGSAWTQSQRKRKARVTQVLCKLLSWQMPGTPGWEWPQQRSHSYTFWAAVGMSSLGIRSYRRRGNPTKMKTAININCRRGETIIFPSLPLKIILGILSINVLP